MRFSRVEGDRRLWLSRTGEIPEHPDECFRGIRGALDQIDAALRHLHLVDHDKMPLPQGRVDQWTNWLMWNVRPDLYVITSEIIELGKGLYVWYREERKHGSHPSGGHFISIPIDTENWLEFAARQADAIADELIEIENPGAAAVAARAALRTATPMMDYKFKEPVLTAKAAVLGGLRSDELLHKLRRRGFPIGGTAKRCIAELEHIVQVCPGREKKIRAWYERLDS